jgi:hypothetical protein
MENHKRILGILYIVSGVLQAIGMLLISIFISAFLPFVLDQADTETHWIVEWMVPLVTIICTAIIILLSIPCIVGGISLLNGKSWALTLLLVLGCFKLFSFPFGTALGIYTIWVYSEDRKAPKAD